VTRKKVKSVYEEKGRKSKDLKNLRIHRQQTKYSEIFKGHLLCCAIFVLALKTYFEIILFLNPPVNNET
jgi:hypothetical protein